MIHMIRPLSNLVLFPESHVLRDRSQGLTERIEVFLVWLFTRTSTGPTLPGTLSQVLGNELKGRIRQQAGKVPLD